VLMFEIAVLFVPSRWYDHFGEEVMSGPIG